MNNKWTKVVTAISLIFVISFLSFYGLNIKSILPATLADLGSNELLRLVGYVSIYFIALKSITLGVTLGLGLFCIDMHRIMKQRLGEMSVQKFSSKVTTEEANAST